MELITHSVLWFQIIGWTYLVVPLVIMSEIQLRFIRDRKQGAYTVKCPKSYGDELSARLAAGSTMRKSRGKQEPTPYKCNKCRNWHLKEGK